MDGQTLYSTMLEYARQLKDQNTSYHDTFSELNTKFAADLAEQDYPSMLTAYKFSWSRYKPSAALVTVTVTYETYTYPPETMASLLSENGYDCTETAEVLQAVYGITDPDEMARILIVGSRCSIPDTIEAIEEVYHVEPHIPHRDPQSYTFEVSARAKWQATPATVREDEVATITYLSGYWRISPATGQLDAGGSRHYIAKPGYMLPGAYEGMLVGLLDGSTFAIGKSGTSPADKNGVLYLAANDDEVPLYGSGYADNSGSITVKIDVNPRP